MPPVHDRVDEPATRMNYQGRHRRQFFASRVIASDMRKRLGSFLLLVALACLGGSRSGLAAADYAAIVVDAESGAVLESHAATARWYPASLTKVMTVYLAFEAIEAGTLRLDEALTVSEHAAAQPATELGLGKGETITVEETILAVILQSANDAAVVLAERLGGSEAKFAELMTAKAAALGMVRTQFRNASGLPDAEQVTTARDMAVLAMALLRNFPQYYHFFSTTSFSYGGHTFGTINGILSRYAGADGIKTGFTCGSGYNLIASAQRDGRRLIGVLLGSHTNFERHTEMGRLLESEWTAGPIVAEAFAAHTIRDEQLRMMFSCCHPRLPEETQVALILNILCGFTAAEIAAAFLTGRAAIAKRIARGKKTLAGSGRLFDLTDAEFAPRLTAVRRALYLLFNEGYHGASARSAVRLAWSPSLSQAKARPRPRVPAGAGTSRQASSDDEARRSGLTQC